MGNGTSSSSSSSSGAVDKLSRRERLKRRLHLHRHHSRRRTPSPPSNTNPISSDDFAGIALLTIVKAELQFKDRWMACVSLGEQAFRTEISDDTDKPVWNSEKKLLLEKNGPHIARISLYETNRIKSGNLIGYCDLDLIDFLTQDTDTESEVLRLSDPSDCNNKVGNILISCSVEDPVETEKRFVRRLLSIMDYNEDGKLSFSEFCALIKAFGNHLASKKKEELFKAADKNGDGVVSIDELASLLAAHQEKEPLINCCPVCGEVLDVSDNLNTVVHLTLCFDEGTGNQVMTGGFLTDKQASYGWMFKLCEWAHFSSYEVGLHFGSSASNIVVIDRRTKRLVEELIDGKIILSLRALYQSKLGLGIIDAGAREILQSLSEKQGKKMNSPESVGDIPKFLDAYKGQINLSEVKYPLDHFKTFNEFFIRELKPGSRPIASIDREDVAVCAGDCRLMAFKRIDDGKRLWIKGRKFSVQGLLGNEISSAAFDGGTLVIFRLAPQDYHRFHSPITGTIEKHVKIPGCLYTVNPIAVNSKYCNVFTDNKREVLIISSHQFGEVAVVAIGATMVGSITFSKHQGDRVKKGDELGYFSFGGSTVICVFEKETIKIDEDLLANSDRSLETLVNMGMRLGVSKR
ncbi:hypothetical protein MLD38_013409 [Melastoma candidum]|uniref:Uncharacterized protein n=1 Tax=Melastoma candidum TaxID=119954 RepID=A0ACB9R9F9_9MYRT|nr:hypothetical protein MLD38_013409 [Melastoma candidum]